MTINKITTNRGNEFDEIHGIRIADPYRWLEDYKNPEVKDWIQKQNENAETNLKGPIFEKISNTLTENFNETNYGIPQPVNGRYFYVERKPNQDQFALYYKDEIDGEAKIIFDPNGSVENDTATISSWMPSATGRYVTYEVCEKGSEMGTLYIRDLDKSENLPYVIDSCRYSSVEWLSDDHGFFYSRHPKKGTVPETEEHLHRKVYFHELGLNPDDDEMIFGQGRPKEDMPGIKISTDDRFLGISATQNWSKNEIYIYDIKAKEIKNIANDIDANFSIGFTTDNALLKTNYKANNFRILSSSLEEMFKPVDEWTELIPETENNLQHFCLTNESIFVEYLVNASSNLIEFDHDGKLKQEVKIPEYSTVTGMKTDKSNGELFFGVTSFVIPYNIYHRSSELSSNDDFVLYQEMNNPINPDDYIIKQEWLESKDGTEVPMFIFHKNNIELNGKNPTILYGYGGFGVTDSPAFNRNRTPWLENGGVYVVANIRGNGEFGDNWHRTGIKDQKQNSFDDFIAAAEHLIKIKYTSKKQLGILGASNGGLLVSVVSMQRPDLFEAVCSKVPLIDMVRFSKFGIAVRWVHEYGDPLKPDELATILKWSPYHNVEPNTQYPNFLFLTADHDTRVDPFHSYKMTAQLQNSDTKNDVLLFVETDAGHGPGKPIKKVIENQALTYTFFAEKLGLDIK